MHLLEFGGTVRNGGMAGDSGAGGRREGRTGRNGKQPVARALAMADSGALTRSHRFSCSFWFPLGNRSEMVAKPGRKVLLRMWEGCQLLDDTWTPALALYPKMTFCGQARRWNSVLHGFPPQPWSFRGIGWVTSCPVSPYPALSPALGP